MNNAIQILGLTYLSARCASHIKIEIGSSDEFCYLYFGFDIFLSKVRVEGLGLGLGLTYFSARLGFRV